MSVGSLHGNRLLTLDTYGPDDLDRDRPIVPGVNQDIVHPNTTISKDKHTLNTATYRELSFLAFGYNTYSIQYKPHTYTSYNGDVFQKDGKGYTSITYANGHKFNVNGEALPYAQRQPNGDIWYSTQPFAPRPEYTDEELVSMHRCEIFHKKIIPALVIITFLAVMTLGIAHIVNIKKNL